jgi:hypothetical protein
MGVYDGPSGTGAGVLHVLSFSCQFWGFTSVMWKAVLLVLLMERIWEVCCWDGLRWHDIRPKFHYNWIRHLSNVRVSTSTIWEAVILVLLIERNHAVCLSDGFTRHDIHTDVQAILRFKIRYMKGCNIGIIGRSKVNRGIHVQTHAHIYKQDGDLTSLFSFFQKRKVD